MQAIKGMTDIMLEIQGREFPLPIRLLLAVTENFPSSWPYAENKYGALADAIIALHIPSLQQALATSHALTFKQEVAIWKSGTLETRRILLDRPGFVNRLGGRIIREILAMDDIAMLEKVARKLRLPENPRDLGSTRALNKETAKELIRVLAIHPAQNVRQALLSNDGIPYIYLKELPQSY